MKRPDLRLVPPSSPSEEKFAPAVEPRCNLAAGDGLQLSLPFDDCTTLRRIVIVSMDQIHGQTLCNLILDLKPKVAIDLRLLIRFDLPGASRAEIFNHLKLVNTLYVKDSMQWNRLKAHDLMLSESTLSHRLNHEVVERDDSPILLLASKKDEARYLGAYLNRILSMRAKRPWRVDQAS
jgi:hypothetical protein